MSRKKVLVFLSRGFEDLEAAAVIDACGWTRYREHLPKVDAVVTGFSRKIRGRFGCRIDADVLVSDVSADGYDSLVIPGGFHSHGFDEAYGQGVLDLVRSVHGAGGIVATMCVGILPVARAGLLNGKKATTYPFSRHHDNPGYLRSCGCEYTGNLVEMDDRIISCAGPAQALQVAMLMLDALLGKEATAELKKFHFFQESQRPADRS